MYIINIFIRSNQILPGLLYITSMYLYYFEILTIDFLNSLNETLIHLNDFK